MYFTCLKDEKFVSKVLKKCESEFKTKKARQFIYKYPELFKMSVENFKFLIETVGESNCGYYKNGIETTLFHINQNMGFYYKYVNPTKWLDMTSIETIEKLDLLCKLTKGSCFDPNKNDIFNTFTIFNHLSETKNEDVLKGLIKLFKKYEFQKHTKGNITLDLMVSNNSHNPKLLDIVYSEFEIKPQLKIFLESLEPMYIDLNLVLGIVKVMVKHKADVSEIDLKNFQDDMKRNQPREAFVTIVEFLIENGCKDNVDLSFYSDKYCSLM